jgi:two-component system, sensor histidine kinase LadS
MISRQRIPIFFPFLALFCLAISSAWASPPLVLHHTTESFPLSGHIDILEDKTGNVTIGQVSSPEMYGVFRSDPGKVPNFGISTSTYWLRFTIQKDMDASSQWLLELDFPHLNYVDVFVPRHEGGFDQMQAGNMRPMSVRRFSHRNPVFPLNVDASPMTVYLRCSTRGRAVMPLTIRTQDDFQRMDHIRDLLAGCYFGAILVMCGYNVFIFLSLRDRNYFYYILDIFFYALVQFYFEGFLIEFDGGKLPWIDSHAIVLCSFPVLAGLTFTRSFLATKQNLPTIDRLMKWLMLAVLPLIPGSFILPATHIRYAFMVTSLCASILALVAGVACLKQGFHPARFFLGARVFRAFSTISVTLGTNNYLPWAIPVQFGLRIGSILDVLFLSFALADRINIMRREKEIAEAEAIRASHLASIGEMAAGVAHEINTPVNTIINSADLILENEDREDTEHDVAAIKKEGRRIATIARSLLFFSRRTDDEKIPFAVSELLQGALDLVGGRLRREKVAITIRVPGGLSDVFVHPQQIEQVFLNILTNAMQALTERHGDAQDVKNVGIVADDTLTNGRHFVRIAFRDNGIGIPASLLGTVKDAFVTTKKSGTGLGLSISRQIIEEHGGSIDIESSEGEYTEIAVTLPAAMNI